ncbi:hypothetical protein AC578_4800 [Pseudocercospora eumusae]|uniref:Zn(2)-C6 fungal-type domain-containing protein n=1 Tax=Pseudocercospora eumusae TaxID=321146 RepID=A0A139HLC9_9PEZI|nr:hypothetical protein AC578_4800 [Pseudocercospora eumusae]KXT03225.1 hypothetical protein AC578_4800 [Pseudocercospora eumusae]
MRSSIACIRCRRSKVKCVNNGVGTTCRSCENSGRECAYPSPVAGGTRRRDSISGRADVYGDAERRQRPRKSTHTFVANPMSGSRESPRPLLDALDARLLTPQVWQELFDIFQIHYSADLPFLHPPTFLKPLRQSALQSAPPTPAGNAPSDSASTARPPASTEFLLAFLALTARFHPKLVQHHSPPTANRASNPLIASEYYAAAANERLASIWTDNRNHDIERTQAALMLGLHEWGMCRGSKAWLTVGMAIRAAQSMGLQYELDLDDEPLSRSLALSAEAERLGMSGESSRKNSRSGKSSEDLFIQQEIRRRTFWSCFIMDRYLSSGKYRPQMLHARELRIQLPASERSFLFAEKVRTLMLGEDDKDIHGTGRAEIQSQRQQSVLLGTGTPEPNQAPSPRTIAMRDDDEKGRLEVGSDEGLVSRYIKILEIYGKVIRWSCSGGRRVEEHPPWDSRCEFYRLRRQCQEFKAALPRQHSLTPQNTQAHISLKTSTPYTLVHTVYLLCQIMLHREYVPFIPIRCSKPEGPMDPPTFPADKYNIPPGFWEESARECFRSAREIMDLVRTCQEWSALVETPIVGFAVYTVAFVGVYCINFPWMDPEGYMCTRPEPNSRPDITAKPGESKGFEAARKALEMIGLMRTKLRMADGWFKTINRMHKYFRKIKNDYKKNVQAIESSSEGDSPISTRHLSLREGGLGGGLDEYKLLERTLIDFGNLEDQDVEMTDANRTDPNKPLDAVYDDSSAGTTVKSEEHGDRPPAATSEPQQKADGGAWSAINAGPGAPAPGSRHPSISTPTSGQFRSYDSYPNQQQPQPSQAATPSSQAPPQPGTYQHQIGGFRPSYSDRPSPSAGPPPSLTSPASQSATGTTPSQAHPSPPYDRHAPPYGAWSAPTPNGTYGMPPPPPNPYANGPVQHQYPPSNHVTPTHSGYPTPGHAHPPHPHGLPAPPQVQQPQQVWDPMAKEAWLNSIDTRLGGDDVAAFVDGGELAEWATMAASQGFGGGWLSAVWQGGHA